MSPVGALLGGIRDKVTSLTRPGGFHGTSKAAPFFEGWYYKLVDADGQRAWAIIPGLFRSPDSGKSHAFVQLYEASSGRRTYVRYPEGAFRFGRALEVGPNRFSEHGLELNLEAEGRKVLGSVRFGALEGWPASFRHPGFMGWMSLLPGVGCHHAVLSLGHSLSGALTIDGRRRSLEGGRGYSEKDWGRKFPERYIWLQCNHFAEQSEAVSLVLSWAQVPWVAQTFEGFVIGLRHPNGFARFATYSGATFQILKATPRELHCVASGGGERLEVRASRPEPSGDPLLLPNGQDMVPGTLQSIDAELEMRLERVGDCVFEARGRCGALEVR